MNDESTAYKTAQYIFSSNSKTNRYFVLQNTISIIPFSEKQTHAHW